MNKHEGEHTQQLLLLDLTLRLRVREHSSKLKVA